MSRFIFVVTIVLAVFLRFYNLSLVPPSLSLDEVSIGYNAYSILKTGVDEYGNTFPILLRAYDDWRPALYVYLVVPFLYVFGLTTFAVRLPSVILSILTVVATYFLVLQIFKKWQHASLLGILTSLFLAISPWHIYLSRLGHEANAGFAFFIFSVFFFFRNNIYIFFLFFALSFASYQSEKIFLPLFFMVLFFLFKERFLQRKKEVILGACIAVAILFPFVKASIAPNALIRFKATNILESNRDRFEKEAFILADAVKDNNIFGQILHNRRVVAATIIAEGYLSHFNPFWLFANFSADRHKVPDLGLFYLWEGLSILVGIVALVKEKINKNIKLFLLSWVLLAPLPAAITSDAPHAMRIYTLLPVPQILAGIGILQIFSFLKKYQYAKHFLFILFFLFITSSVFYFSYKYFVIFPKTQSSSFQYALSQAIPFVLEKEKKYNKIVFSNQDSLYQSYMFFLFFSRYDPHLYQKQGGTVSGGFEETHTFDKYEFRPISYSIEKEKTLLIGNVLDFPKDKKPMMVFTNLDGKEVIKVIER